MHGNCKQRSKKEMLIIKAGLKTGFYKTVNTKKAFEKFDALCQKYPYETSSIVGNTYGVYKTKEFVAKKVFGKGCMLPFEDIEICCTQDYHYYLCHIYGDYQKLPPEEERKGHEIKFA